MLAFHGMLAPAKVDYQPDDHLELLPWLWRSK